MEAGASYTVAITMPQRRASDCVPTRFTPPASRELRELHAARDFIAMQVADNPLLDPLFDRLDREIEIEEAKLLADDPVTRAKAIVAARRKTN